MALEESIDAIDNRSRLTRLLNAKITKTIVGNELLGEMELEFADSPSKPALRIERSS